MTAEPPEGAPLDRGPRLADLRRGVDQQAVEVAALEAGQLLPDDQQMSADLIVRIEVGGQRDRVTQFSALDLPVRVDDVGDLRQDPGGH